jgi:hypothetical protein
MNWCQKARISPINPGWWGWLSAGEDVDEDTMVAMAVLPVARRFSLEKIAPNRCKGSLGGID